MTFEEFIFCIPLFGIFLFLLLWAGIFGQPPSPYRHYNNNHVARNINNHNASNWIERRREPFIRLQRNSNSPARKRIQGYFIPVFQRLNVHQTIMYNPALGLFVYHLLCLYRDKISVYLQRHPRAGRDTHLTSTQELVKIHNMCEDISI